MIKLRGRFLLAVCIWLFVCASGSAGRADEAVTHAVQWLSALLTSDSAALREATCQADRALLADAASLDRLVRALAGEEAIRLRDPAAPQQVDLSRVTTENLEASATQVRVRVMGPVILMAGAASATFRLNAELTLSLEAGQWKVCPLTAAALAEQPAADVSQAPRVSSQTRALMKEMARRALPPHALSGSGNGPLAEAVDTPQVVAPAPQSRPTCGPSTNVECPRSSAAPTR